MLGTHRISEAQLLDLLRRARKTDFGRWKKADLQRAMTSLGWQVPSTEVDIDMWRAETGYDTGNAIADSIPPQTPVTGRADFYSVEVMVLHSAERGRQGEQHRTLIFREVLRTMTSELGAPEIRGGDGGPWTRWYRDGLIFELHLRRFHGGVTLRLLSPELFEQLEAHAVGKGDVSGWAAYARAKQHPPEPNCSGMGEFTERLSSLLAEMAADVPVFDTSGTVMLRTRDWPGGYVAAFIDGSLRLEASTAVSANWTSDLSRQSSMGFQAPHIGQPNRSRTFLAVDRAAATQASHMMVDTLRAFGVQDPTEIVYDGFTAEGEHLYLPALGVGNAPSDDPVTAEVEWSSSPQRAMVRQSQDTITIAVSIYLGDGRAHGAVEAALELLLEETGLEPHGHERPIVGSWFRKLWARTRDETKHLSAAQIAAEIERKVRIEVFDKSQAGIDNQQATGAAALIAALQGEERACVRVGSILVIKVDGIVMVNNLTQIQLAWLERNQKLLRDPEALLKGLETQGDPMRDLGHVRQVAKTLGDVHDREIADGEFVESDHD